MTLKDTLAKVGQEHLLQYEAALTADERERLHQQLSKIDFLQLKRLVSDKEANVNWGELAARAEPPPAVRLDRLIRCSPLLKL